MVGAIKGCTGVEPTIVGKPSPLMIDYIVDKYGVERQVLTLPLAYGAVSVGACFQNQSCPDVFFITSPFC